MKSRKFLLLLLPLIIFLTSGGICHGADIFVDDDICPATGSGTSLDPYCSIVYAITQAVSGDTVYVHQGTYAEAVIMKTGVDLRNVSGEQPKIVTEIPYVPGCMPECSLECDPVGCVPAKNHVLFDSVNNCTLDGFVLDGSNRTTEEGYAIVFADGTATNRGDGLAIRNCEITGSPLSSGDALDRAGIRLRGYLSIEITGNTIKNMQRAGITTKVMGNSRLYYSTVIIQGNVITQNGTVGIDLRGSSADNHIIIGGDDDAANIISDHGWARGGGIRLSQLKRVAIDNNEIFNNTHGGLMLLSINTVSPHISRNSIHDNLKGGINISGDSTLTISNNEIFHNTQAGIAFRVDDVPVSSAPVMITSNNIHTNATAGIAVVNHVTGPISISNNTIHQNEKAGIAFFNHCVATITNNDIYSHTGAAGIFTGDWGWLEGIPPTELGFDRTNGPVELTISKNKIHDNLAGMRLDHASGTINNNLVYDNSKSGIRFSGNDVAPYEPFGISWGITSLSNNTVADNGTLVDGIHRGGGGGIVYDDINISDRGFNTKPVQNRAQGPRFIQNNILAYNVSTGVNDASCSVERDYNLYYWNFGKEFFSTHAIGSCHTGEYPIFTGNPNEIFADPLFVDRIAYQLQPGSPAKASGNDGLDMGAYGGSDPITW